MNKVISIVFAMLGVYALSAQCPQPMDGAPKSSDVSSAAMTMSSSTGADPLEAASFIERGKNHEKSVEKVKTWKTRGDIYLALEATLPGSCPEALFIARDSYITAKKKDLKMRSTKSLNEGLLRTGNAAYNKGYDNFSSENYDEAAKYFQLCADAFTDAEATADSLYMGALYNAGLAYDNSGDLDKAEEYYRKSIDANYLAVQSYSNIIGISTKAEDLDKALAVVEEAKAKFPEEPHFLLKETDIHLKNGDYAKAEGNLTKAVENDPDNAMLYFVLGSTLDQLDKPTEAADAYKKAIEIDPGYSDAYHNLGANFVNYSIALKKKAGDLDFRSDAAEIEDLENQADQALKDAMPFLEKALEMEPTNMQVMSSLKTIYFNFEMNDKYEAMKAKIDSMKG